MALAWTDMQQNHIWTYLVSKYGLSKTDARSAIAAMSGDAVNMLLLPNPATWPEVWQCAHACFRKRTGQVPIVMSIADILGDLLGGLLGQEPEEGAR